MFAAKSPVCSDQVFVKIAVLAMVWGVSACDSTTPNVGGGAQIEVRLEGDQLQTALPEPVLANQPLMEGLAQGKSAALMLDRCPDPVPSGLGSLVCGQTYRLSWDAQTRRWLAFGPNGILPQGAGFQSTLGKYPGQPPSQKVAVVWGLWLTIQPDMSVQMEKGPIIGTLRHMSDVGNVTNPAPSSIGQGQTR